MGREINVEASKWPSEKAPVSHFSKSFEIIVEFNPLMPEGYLSVHFSNGKQNCRQFQAENFARRKNLSTEYFVRLYDN